MSPVSTTYIPLPERVRPQRLEDIVGQHHLLSPHSTMYKMVKKKQLRSMILWGGPGTGKTTIAHIVASEMGIPFFSLSAATTGVPEIRTIIEKSAEQHHILFLDEIHRFNKSQQDILLQAIEKGLITLIGATTENPSFEINKALLSRCHVFVLEPLTREELLQILQKAISTDEILRSKHIIIEETDALFDYAEGDARRMLGIVDIVCHTAQEEGTVTISNVSIREALQQKTSIYDKNGEEHYNVISAFIKSIRGSDPNAAVYWLSRMLVAGEDILFIARRMIILAAEDIGLANPNALMLATSTFQAVHSIGMPEARIVLSECAIYLATSPKSNSAYMAISKGMQSAEKSPTYAVPLHLRNAPTQLMKQLNYGKAYAYAHHFEENFADQEYLPTALVGTVFYTPQQNEREKAIQLFLEKRWKNKYRHDG